MHLGMGRQQPPAAARQVCKAELVAGLTARASVPQGGCPAAAHQAARHLACMPGVTVATTKAVMLLPHACRAWAACCGNAAAAARSHVSPCRPPCRHEMHMCCPPTSTPAAPAANAAATNGIRCTFATGTVFCFAARCSPAQTTTPNPAPAASTACSTAELTAVQCSESAAIDERSTLEHQQS